MTMSRFAVLLSCSLLAVANTSPSSQYPTVSVSWSVVNEDAAWGARGWFDVATLTMIADPYADITPSSDLSLRNSPRMWLAGGGYIGQKGNSIVSTMIAYVDMWFSYDGSMWYQVSVIQDSHAGLTRRCSGSQRSTAQVHFSAWFRKLEEVPFVLRLSKLRLSATKLNSLCQPQTAPGFMAMNMS